MRRFKQGDRVRININWIQTTTRYTECRER